MSVPMLNWRTVTNSRSPQFFVRGTRLAVAFYLSHRFGIYEVRGTANRDGSYDDYYAITDAQTVSDADLRKGVAPTRVFTSNGLDLAAVIAWCDSQP